MHDLERLLSSQEAAKYLGIAEPTLRISRMKGGGIPFIKMGRLVKYRIADIENYLAIRTYKSTSEIGGAI